jgi:hypothetical protein
VQFVSVQVASVLKHEIRKLLNIHAEVPARDLGREVAWARRSMT